MSVHWILVCDAASAVIYESDALLEELTLVESVSPHHLGSAGHDASGAHQDPHKVDEERYARMAAAALNTGNDQHRFERLIVVAPPHFLGELRNALSTGTARKVVLSVHHDWTKLGLRELATQIRKALPAA